MPAFLPGPGRSSPSAAQLCVSPVAPALHVPAVGQAGRDLLLHLPGASVDMWPALRWEPDSGRFACCKSLGEAVRFAGSLAGSVLQAGKLRRLRPWVGYSAEGVCVSGVPLHFTRALLHCFCHLATLATASSCYCPGQRFSLVPGGERLGSQNQSPTLLQGPWNVPIHQSCDGTSVPMSSVCSRKPWLGRAGSAASQPPALIQAHGGTLREPLLWLVPKATESPGSSGHVLREPKDPFLHPASPAVRLTGRIHLSKAGLPISDTEEWMPDLELAPTPLPRLTHTGPGKHTGLLEVKD